MTGTIATGKATVQRALSNCTGQMRAPRYTVPRTEGLARICIIAAIFVLSVTALDFGHGQAFAQPAGQRLDPVTIGFVRHAIGPWTARITDGGFEKASGRAIRWRSYDTDAEVVSAMAGGRADIGLIGACVAAAAYAGGFDLKMFYVLGRPADGEAIVRTGSRGPAGDLRALVGKVIAVPFDTTLHFRLLSSLKVRELALNDIRLVNLQVPQILNAWKRREIDAAVVSEPTLRRLQRDGGTVPLDRTEPAGGLLVLAGAAKFVDKNAVLLARIVGEMARADQTYFSHGGADATPADSTADQRAIATMLGLTQAEVAAGIDRFNAPPLEQQASTSWLGGGPYSGLAAGLRANALIWQWGGRLKKIDTDFINAVTAEPVSRALAFKR